MAKKFTASKSQLKPDAVYNSKLVSKFVNCLMLDGKKSIAQKVFADAMGIISEKISDSQPLEVFEMAINNVKPMVEVRSKRVGGASYQVPMQVKPKRQQALAAVADLVHQRAKCREALVHVRIISLDNSDAWSRLSGYQIALTFLPLFYADCLSKLGRCVMHQGCQYYLFFDVQVPYADLTEGLGKTFIDLPVTT